MGIRGWQYSKLVLLNASVLDLNALKTIWTEISAMAYKGVSFYVVVSQKISFCFLCLATYAGSFVNKLSFNSAISKYVLKWLSRYVVASMLVDENK